MAKRLPKRACPTCAGSRVKKNGTTKAGKTRYRCLDCGASHTATRTLSRQTYTFEAFSRYVLGKASLADLDRGSQRSVRREFSWCWDVPVPAPSPTGVVHDQVFIDGTYLHGGWVLLIACTATHILNWQLAARENSAAYTALLAPIAPPLMVVTDGVKGALQAITRLWPDTRIQRCLIHVQRNNRVDLTRNPKTTPGRILAQLSTRLTRITNDNELSKWLNDFNAFYQTYSAYLKERTYARDLPENERKPGRTWWYTHERDRRVYLRLKHLLKKKQLFAYLTQNHAAHSTTNVVESHNAAIKLILRHHRGWSARQQTQAAYHYLNTHTETPYTPRQILENWRKTGQATYTLIPPAPTRPAPPPPTINEHAPWEDGLTIRQGWAGR